TGDRRLGALIRRRRLRKGTRAPHATRAFILFARRHARNSARHHCAQPGASLMRDLFEQTIERIFSDLVSPALIHQCADGAWPETLWSTLEEAEMTFAAVPETLGGAGAGWDDTFTLVRAAGAHAVPA